MKAREQGARYLVIGAWNTLFGYVLFATLQLTLGDDINYIFLLVVAQFLATVNAFIGYRLFVFKVKGNVLMDFARFSVVYIGSFALNLVALPFMHEVLDVPVLLAQAIIVTATVLGTFFLHRSFSFRRAPEPER